MITKIIKMPIEFKTEEKKTYLYVDLLENSVIKEDFAEFAESIKGIAEKSDFSKIMINVNLTLIPNSRIRTFDIVELLKAKLSHLKMAFVYHEKMFSELKYFENVAVNQGVNLHVFFDRTSAEEWLLN
jgi:hypothetical protein